MNTRLCADDAAGDMRWSYTDSGQARPARCAAYTLTIDISRLTTDTLQRFSGDNFSSPPTVKARRLLISWRRLRAAAGRAATTSRPRALMPIGFGGAAVAGIFRRWLGRLHGTYSAIADM